ncbi:MAG: ATP-binding protein [Pseudomonadota bacterium]
MLKIRTKIIFIVIAVLLGSIGASTLISSYFFTHELSGAFQSEALVIGQTLKSQLDRLLRLNIPVENLVGFDEQCLEIVDKYREITYAMVVDTGGKILFHNDPFQRGGHIDDPALLKGILSAEERIQTYSHRGVRYYDVMIPVFDSGHRHVATVRVGFPADFISDKTKELFLYSLAIAAIFCFFAIILLIYVLSVWISKPLTRLLKVIQEVGKENTEDRRRADIFSRDEIGLLGQAFNEMMDDLEEYQEKIKSHAGELENRVKERTRELETAQRELVNKAMEAGRAQLSAMVLHNIGNAMTPVRVHVESMKSDELTRIADYLEKSYADLCEHGPDLQRYVNDDPRGKEIFSFMGKLVDSLKSNTDRTKKVMNDIEGVIQYISDILTLQQSYAAKEFETKEQVGLNRLLEDAVKMQKGILEKRDIDVRMDLEPDLPKLLIDKSRLIQVIINLIKNSYEAFDSLADQGREKRIMLKTFHDPDGFGFEIADTGTGILPEALASVCEFGISSKGSSGFGLHYCKTFLEKNKGTLTVSSPGKEKGTTVSVSFEDRKLEK